MPSIWIARLFISGRTESKLIGRGIDIDELRVALVCVTGLPFTWDDHPERGRRAILRMQNRSSDVLVVLYPRPDPFGDAWNLGSVYWV